MLIEAMPKWVHWFWITLILSGLSPVHSDAANVLPVVPSLFHLTEKSRPEPLTIVTPSSVVRDDEMTKIFERKSRQNFDETKSKDDARFPEGENVSKSVSVVSVKYSLSDENDRHASLETTIAGSSRSPSTTQSKTTTERSSTTPSPVQTRSTPTPTISPTSTPVTSTSSTSSRPSTTSGPVTTSSKRQVDRSSAPRNLKMFSMADEITKTSLTTETNTISTRGPTVVGSEAEANTASSALTTTTTIAPQSTLESSSKFDSIFLKVLAGSVEEKFRSNVTSSGFRDQSNVQIESMNSESDPKNFHERHLETQKESTTQRTSITTAVSSPLTTSTAAVTTSPTSTSVPTTSATASSSTSTTMTSESTPNRIVLQEVEEMEDDVDDGNATSFQNKPLQSNPPSSRRINDDVFSETDYAKDASSTNHGKMIVEYLEDSELARSFPSTKWSVFKDTDGTWYLQETDQSSSSTSEPRIDSEKDFEGVPRVVDLSDSSSSFMDLEDSDRDEEPYEKFMAEESGRSFSSIINDEYFDTTEDEVLPNFEEKNYNDDEPEVGRIEPRMLSTMQRPSDSRQARLEDSHDWSEPRSRVPPNIDVATVVGITIGAFLFILVGTVCLGAFIYHEKYINKPQALEERFSSSSSDRSSVEDPYSRISQIDCIEFDTTRDTFCEEMYNLDNDSFLNSLETVNVASSYWIHDRRSSDSDV